MQAALASRATRFKPLIALGDLESGARTRVRVLSLGQTIGNLVAGGIQQSQQPDDGWSSEGTTGATVHNTPVEVSDLPPIDMPTVDLSGLIATVPSLNIASDIASTPTPNVVISQHAAQSSPTMGELIPANYVQPQEWQDSSNGQWMYQDSGGALYSWDNNQSQWIETVIVTPNGGKDAAIGLGGWIGATGYATGAVRNAYQNDVAGLDPADSAGRTRLKVYYRSVTPQPMRAFVEMTRPGTGPRLGSNVSANLSNAGWNTAGEVFSTVGKVSLAGTIAYDAYDIATSNNRVQTASVDVGSTAGGVAGGWAGAEAGAAIGAGIGVWFGGVGAVPGAFIGGVIGGIAGSVGGGYYGGQAGQYLYNKYGK